MPNSKQLISKRWKPRDCSNYHSIQFSILKLYLILLTDKRKTTYHPLRARYPLEIPRPPTRNHNANENPSRRGNFPLKNSMSMSVRRQPNIKRHFTAAEAPKSQIRPTTLATGTNHIHPAVWCLVSVKVRSGCGSDLKWNTQRHSLSGTRWKFGNLTFYK